MTPPDADIAADIALAHRLADAAGAAIRPFFRAAFTMEAEADASPRRSGSRRRGRDPLDLRRNGLVDPLVPSGVGDSRSIAEKPTQPDG